MIIEGTFVMASWPRPCMHKLPSHLPASPLILGQDFSSDRPDQLYLHGDVRGGTDDALMSKKRPAEAAPETEYNPYETQASSRPETLCCGTIAVVWYLKIYATFLQVLSESKHIPLHIKALDKGMHHPSGFLAVADLLQADSLRPDNRVCSAAQDRWQGHHQEKLQSQGQVASADDSCSQQSYDRINQVRAWCRYLIAVAGQLAALAAGKLVRCSPMLSPCSTACHAASQTGSFYLQQRQDLACV